MFSRQGRLLLFTLLAACGLVGCGGGGGSSTGSNTGGNNNGGNPSGRVVSGTVTDVNGAPIVGALVKIGSQQAVSVQAGTYILSNVVVPAGQSALVTQITANASVNG